jgi:hypothetical protein
MLRERLSSEIAGGVSDIKPEINFLIFFPEAKTKLLLFLHLSRVFFISHFWWLIFGKE